MEEPLEDRFCSKIEFDEDDIKVPTSHGLVPGTSMVVVNMSREDYEIHYWPKLEAAIQQLLTLSPGEYVPISYEQMYSCVYKCVCKQFSERLYSDLIEYIRRYLECVSVELHNVDTTGYILKFNAVMSQYIQALGGIVPIFNYMNRFYVENKLHSDLKTELLRIFTVTVAESHIPKLIPMLEEAQSKPFSVAPPVMASLIKGLYSLKPEFARLSPDLFAKHIPNVLPPMNVTDLPQYVAETHKEQEELIQKGFERGDQSRKRPGDGDIPKVTALYNTAANQNAINHNLW